MDKTTKNILLVGGIGAGLYYLWNYTSLGAMFGGGAAIAPGPTVYLPPQPLPSQMTSLDTYGTDYNPMTGEYAGPGTTPNF